MNTNTGQIYENQYEIGKAIERGEPVVPVSKRVVKIVRAGHAAIEKARKVRRRKREKIARVSRKKNRR
jgi:hypothetical protein